MPLSRRTQVGIVGAGPAGLILAHLLHGRGIDSVVLEARSREYCEQRVRAGFLEDTTANFLAEIGVGERMRAQGMVHDAFVIRVQGADHRVPFAELTGGRTMTIYGQEELVRDLIAMRLATGRPLAFDHPVLELRDVDSQHPAIIYVAGGERRELCCDIIVGCDGFHGPCRGALRPDVYARDFPLAWLGILAAVPPAIDEIVYAWHDRGFALHSVRSPLLSRLHLQCDPGEDPDTWSDERIWDELELRLAGPGGRLDRGPIVKRTFVPLRSFVAEPMRRGHLVLAGDAAHIVPPTGAKGLNLAVADVRVLFDRLCRWFEDGDDDLLEDYSMTCLRHVWEVQRFSSWMTSVLHRFPHHDAFDRRLQVAELIRVASSRPAATALAESYVGLDRATARASDGQLATIG